MTVRQMCDNCDREVNPMLATTARIAAGEPLDFCSSQCLREFLDGRTHRITRT